MRTTIRIDEDLLREAKRHAAETGRTFTALVEDSLRECLGRRKPAEPRKPIRFTTVAGPPLPGVDIDDSRALRDIMDSPDAVA